MKDDKCIGCMFDSSSKQSLDAYRELSERYSIYPVEKHPEAKFDVVITLGGDGVMLKALHRFIDSPIPIYGMNKGSIGFLLNKYSKTNLIGRIKEAVHVKLRPLAMIAQTMDGEMHSVLAINEVSLLRQTSQAAKIKILINNKMRLNHLISDGVLVSTPAGSSAYNYAVQGPLIPLSANVLALTPISPFRPRKWRGALLHHSNSVRFEVLEPEKRPVSASADSQEIRDVRKVKIFERQDLELTILFDPQDRFEERLIKEQFI